MEEDEMQAIGDRARRIAELADEIGSLYKDFFGPRCLACRYVYVVASGGFRYAVESETELSPLSAFEAALPRFEEGGNSLAMLVQVTECSEDSDASDPFYLYTIDSLKKLGKFGETND